MKCNLLICIGSAIPESYRANSLIQICACGRTCLCKFTFEMRHGVLPHLVRALLVLFTPALWSVANDLTTGEHFFDMPVMVLTLSLVLLSAMFAILLMTWRGGRNAARDE